MIASMRTKSEPIEALAWLEESPDTHWFAPERWAFLEDVIEYVRTLYSCGADAVYVSGLEDEGEDCQSADTLVVRVPRERILNMTHGCCILPAANDPWRWDETHGWFDLYYGEEEKG